MARSLLLPVVIVGVLVLAACDASQQQPAPDGTTTGKPAQEHEQPSPDGPAARHTYTVRGVVVDLPAPDRPASDFVLEHEEIPDFVRSDGSLGMPAMRMPFSSQEPIDLSALTIGDKVAFEWTVWWEGSFPHSIIRNIRVLDPDTPLALPSTMGEADVPDGGDG